MGRTKHPVHQDNTHNKKKSKSKSKPKPKPKLKNKPSTKNAPKRKKSLSYDVNKEKRWILVKNKGKKNTPPTKGTKRKRRVSGESMSESIISAQFGLIRASSPGQKVEAYKKFRRRINNVAKNINTKHRFGLDAATNISRLNNEFIAQITSMAVTFARNAGRKVVQVKDIQAVVESNIDIMYKLSPHTVRVPIDV